MGAEKKVKAYFFSSSLGQSESLEQSGHGFLQQGLSQDDFCSPQGGRSPWGWFILQQQPENNRAVAVRSAKINIDIIFFIGNVSFGMYPQSAIAGLDDFYIITASVWIAQF
jgi:hypothetical protein